VTAGDPTPEEMAAIVAAIEMVWPQPVVVAPQPGPVSPRWRFAGRWWARAIPVRRDRP
jgi:hypothetical protein